MNTRSSSMRTKISFAAFYLVFAATAARAYMALGRSPDVGLMTGLLSFYLLLLLIEPWLIKKNMFYLHLVNALQTVIALVLLAFVSEFDFFALLFVPPCALSVVTFPRKTALAWVGGICVLMVLVLLDNFPIEDSIGFVIIYPTAIFLFSGFNYMAMQADEARQRSESLLADLRQANLQLQVYAAQVQELSAAEERNRLARELHDSVTQVIFGMTLSAQAARILLDRDPSRVAPQLDHIQALAQNALAEMRSLIQQLHPRSIAEEGLTPALRRLSAERQSADGISVDLQVSGERRLPAQVEEALYRVAQESLNNIAKHARTDHARITLKLDDGHRVQMSVEDDGSGFDPGKIGTAPGHLGLASMTERVKALGGTLQIDSRPGKGTRLCIDIALSEEVAHA